MSLSPQTSAPGYAPNGPAYGTFTVAEVNHAAFASAYTCKPTDDLVLVDLASYSTGPTINWSPTPKERMRVCVRNTTGNASSKPFTIAAPSGMTIEDPANPGSFAATVTTSVANFSGIWELDRPNSRLLLVSGSGVGSLLFGRWTAVAAGSTVAVTNGAMYAADSTGAQVTFDLPAAPPDGFSALFKLKGATVPIPVKVVAAGSDVTEDPQNPGTFLVTADLTQPGQVYAVVYQHATAQFVGVIL